MEVVRQEGIKDCGVCSLLSVIRYYGGDVSLEYLRELTNTTKNGVSAYNLVKAATSIGFNSYGINTEIEKIKKDMLPIISHVIINKSYQHFIVIYNINFKKNIIEVMDPAYGYKIISIKEFHLLSSNNYIYLKPNRKILKLERKKVINNWIFSFIKDNKNFFPYILILTTIHFILTIITAFYFKLVLNKSINYSIIENTIIISISMLIIFLFKEITFFLKNINLLKCSELFNDEIEIKLLKRITLLPYLYYKNRTTGEIVSRLKDLEVIKRFVVLFISTFILDLTIVLLFLLFLYKINKSLFIIVLLISIIIFIKSIIYNKIYIKKEEDYKKREDKVNSCLYENINFMSTIKSLHIEKEQINSFKKLYSKYLQKSYSLNRIIICNKSVDNFLNDLLVFFLISIGSILIIKNKFSLSDLIIFQSILNYYLSSFDNLILIYDDYYKYKLAKRRIEDLFTINIENFNNYEYFTDYNLVGTIKIKNLNYSYGTKTIFNNLNLIIKKKDKVFLSGKSGIGKSTLMKILTRLISIDYGYIKINNIDINHYHLDTIRNKILYISQNEILINKTIKENILLGKEIEEEKLEKILKITRLEKILDNTLGLSKMVEENGNNFSGGERQKIILARSIIRDRDIYIFDEALNQIDIKEEKEILTNIIKYLKDKVVIVISHRQNSFDLFNRNLILEDGVIHEKL